MAPPGQTKGLSVHAVKDHAQELGVLDLLGPLQKLLGVPVGPHKLPLQKCGLG